MTPIRLERSIQTFTGRDKQVITRQIPNCSIGVVDLSFKGDPCFIGCVQDQERTGFALPNVRRPVRRSEVVPVLFIGPFTTGVKTLENPKQQLVVKVRELYKLNKAQIVPQLKINRLATNYFQSLYSFFVIDTIHVDCLLKIKIFYENYCYTLFT